jgi:hypothetical protein
LNVIGSNSLISVSNKCFQNEKDCISFLLNEANAEETRSETTNTSGFVHLLSTNSDFIVINENCELSLVKSSFLMSHKKDNIDDNIIMLILSNLHSLLTSSFSSPFAVDMFFRSVISLWLRLSHVQV